MRKLIMSGIVIAGVLCGCKNVEITTETTEKTFDKENKVATEKTTKTTQKDGSFTCGFSEGSNKQINIVPLDISVVK